MPHTSSLNRGNSDQQRKIEFTAVANRTTGMPGEGLRRSGSLRLRVRSCRGGTPARDRASWTGGLGRGSPTAKSAAAGRPRRRGGAEDALATPKSCSCSQFILYDVFVLSTNYPLQSNASVLCRSCILFCITCCMFLCTFWRAVATGVASLPTASTAAYSGRASQPRAAAAISTVAAATVAMA